MRGKILRMFPAEALQHKNHHILALRHRRLDKFRIMIRGIQLRQLILAEIDRRIQLPHPDGAEQTERVAQNQGSFLRRLRVINRIADRHGKGLLVGRASDAEHPQRDHNGQPNRSDPIIQPIVSQLRGVVFDFLIDEKQKENQRRTEQHEVPVLAHRLEKDVKGVVIFAEEVHFLGSNPFESITEIDNV